MRSNTKFINLAVGILIIFVASMFFNQTCFALVEQFGTRALTVSPNTARLSEEEETIFAQNGLTGWNPGECVNGNSGNSSGMCGDTPQKKYWSFLRQYFDEVHAAAILGNMDNEGGYGPTRWEIGRVVDADGGSFIRSWDSLYNCGDVETGGCNVGVGSVGITWYLSNYLHYINDNFPDSLQYFQDSKYSLPGSSLLPLMGDTLYNQIAQTELTYIVEIDAPRALGESGLKEFESITDVREAAKYWAENYERCNGCLASSGMTATKQSRMDDAAYEYESLKGFVCTGSSSSTKSSNSTSASSNSNSDSVSGSDITFIGDSLTALGGEDLFNEYFSGADYGSSFNTCYQGDESSYVCSGKKIDTDMGANGGTSGLKILEKIVSNNKLRPILVFALGANSQWTQGYVDRLLELVGSDTKVLILTTKTIPPHQLANGGYDANNNFLKETADKYDNIYVADWATAVEDKNYISDGLHYTSPDGYRAYYQFIADALKNLGVSCTTYEGDYPQYFQSAEPWGSINYPAGSGTTIAGAGCGAASMAMLTTVATGQDVFPQDVAEITASTPYYDVGGSGMTNNDIKVCEKYGCKVENVSWSSFEDAISKIKQYLKDGWMIHLSGQGNPPFSSVGHYIGIFKLVDENTVMVADSSGGNKEWDLHDLVYAGMHYDFSVIRGNGSKNTCDNDFCPNNNNSYDGSKDVLTAVADIIILANKNGSTYTWGGGHTNDPSVFDAMLSGGEINVDCTGFASLVMYKTYGQMTSFTSASIFSDPLYEEIPRADVRPGDIFAYNDPTGHGGIVIEASNGLVTKIAETGGSEGKTGKNSNIGYSGAESFSVTNMNSQNGHFFRWKGGN